jgi:hypothetical protein
MDAVLLMVPTIVGAPLLRHAYNRWGTTKGEGRGRMPGDELIEVPKLVSTRSITIDAPPEEVWRWLVQIGQGRGGLYSYDALENAIGCDIHSAERIVEELQDLEVGDFVRLGPDSYPAFRVDSLEPSRSLVLVGVDPTTHEAPPMPVTDDATTAATWSWQLTRKGNGSRTRLVTRQRTTFPGAQSVLWHVVEPISFVMMRRMLLGIKQRAERSPWRSTGATWTRLRWLKRTSWSAPSQREETMAVLGDGSGESSTDGGAPTSPTPPPTAVTTPHATPTGAGFDVTNRQRR